MNIFRFWNDQQTDKIPKRWLIVNSVMAAYFFALSLLSMFCFYFFEGGFWWDCSVLWSIAGTYTGFWVLTAYFFAYNKRGEVSAFIYLIFLILNFITLSGIFLFDIYEYMMLLVNYSLTPTVIFIYSQYYISFLVLILLYALAIDATFQLLQSNRLRSSPELAKQS